MSSFVPSVEERLRSSIVLCDTLKQSALLADEQTLVGVSPFTPTEILRAVPGSMEILSRQLAAVRAVLPTTCLNLPAPAEGGRP